MAVTHTYFITWLNALKLEEFTTVLDLPMVIDSNQSLMKTSLMLSHIHWLISMMLRAKTSFFKARKRQLWKIYWAFLKLHSARVKVQPSSQIHCCVWISQTTLKSSSWALLTTKTLDVLLSTSNHRDQIWNKATELTSLRAPTWLNHPRASEIHIKDKDIRRRTLHSQPSLTIKWLLLIEKTA